MAQGDKLTFNTTTKKLPTIEIDGSLFEIRPIGAGHLLDIEELTSTITETKATTEEESKSQLSKTRELFNLVESLLIQKGDLTAKEVIRRIPAKKLGEFIKLLAEA